MRTLEAIKKLAKKMTGKTTVTGSTIDEVIGFIESNVQNASAIYENDGKTAKKATEATSANGLVLTSPDESVWDISIANDGTISGTKRV